MSDVAATDVLVVDRGPVRDAALVLVGQSTLGDHVIVLDGEHTTRIEMDGVIPFEMWGSGTQALWRLLSAVAHMRFQVSLYEVISRLDRRNKLAVARAVAVLCAEEPS